MVKLHLKQISNRELLTGLQESNSITRDPSEEE